MDLTIAGVSRPNKPSDDQLSRMRLEFAAFDGEVGNGEFPIGDPDKDFDVATGRQFRVDEGSTLLTDGFMLDQDRTRGFEPQGREYSLGIQDANALLDGFRIFRKRNSETDYARVLAFAAADFPDWDTAMVINANTVTMPKKTYDSDGGWTAELIPDVVEYTGKTLFVHDKADGSGRCLHYHTLNSGHACGLSISDVVGAENGTTVWYPWNPQRSRTSVDLRNSIKGRDQAGRTSIQSDSGSIAEHDADGLQHEALIQFEANNQSDLNVQTAATLASFKDDLDTWSCSIGPLDEDALALIRVGDIITVTSDVMGLTAGEKRIAHLTLSPAFGEGDKPIPDRWMADLELGAPKRRRARVKNKAIVDRVQHTPIPYPPDFCGDVVTDIDLSGSWDTLSHPQETPDPTVIAPSGTMVDITMTPQSGPMAEGDHVVTVNRKGGEGTAFLPFDPVVVGDGVLRLTATVFLTAYDGNDDATQQVTGVVDIGLTSGATDAASVEGAVLIAAGVVVVPDPDAPLTWPRPAAVPDVHYVPEGAPAPTYGGFYRVILELSAADGRRLKIWPASGDEPDDWYDFGGSGSVTVDGLYFHGSAQLTQNGVAVYTGFPDRENFFQLASYTNSVSDIAVTYTETVPCPPVALHGLPYGPVFIGTADGSTATFDLPEYPPDPILSVRGFVNGNYEPSTYDPDTRQFTFADEPEAGDDIDAEIIPL